MATRMPSSGRSIRVRISPSLLGTLGIASDGPSWTGGAIARHSGGSRLSLESRSANPNCAGVSRVRSPGCERGLRSKYLWERGFQRFKRGGVIRRQQPVIGDEQQFVATKTRTIFQTGFRFDQRSRLQDSLKARAQRFFKRSSRQLSKVDEPWNPFPHLRAEIAFMAHEQNPGPMMNMAVIVNVDQLMLLDSLLLNPGMEDRNKFPTFHSGGISRDELETKSGKFHQRVPRSASIS